MLIDAEIFLRLIDVAGVFVFALSGGLVAIRQDMDLFGIVVVSFLPAVGGGTLRDLLLDQPVFWLNDPISLLAAMIGGIAAFLSPGFWARLRVLVWIDAVGLSLFAMTGASKALDFGHGIFVVIIMGTITATAGGLIRDIVCGEKAMLLREDIYATAALIGCLVFWILRNVSFDASLSLFLGAVTIFLIRAIAIKYDLNLPKPHSKSR
ncbi:MAG: trimeric intracellular cation channel family protein [Henriciella sp.]|nr:trimeric intracellular cation channel family protein [Henriciella sp.]MBO6695695.1 trimeric intracellular cation channel family protein [Henriciella sp.]